jgi:copper chaperone
MITLKVPELSCGHCIKTIDGAVKAVDPAAWIDADLATHTIVVKSDADEARLRQAIADAGYDNEKLAA